MNKKASLILSLIIAICAAVAVFVLFAAPFGNEGNEPASRAANCFILMFGSSTSGYRPVPLLIVGLVFECLAFVTAFVAGFIRGKIGAIIYGVTTIMLVASGIFFLMSPALYTAANADLISQVAPGNIQLGAGSITTAIFCFFGGVLSLYGAYANFKA